MSKTKIASPEIKPELLKLANERQTFLLGNIASKLGLLEIPAIQQGNTDSEEVVCAGYNPYYKRLEAVVNVKQPTGYNGNLCSIGSREFVRFFVDFKDGAGFRNMGYTSFKVANISNNPAGPQHPLSYVAYLVIDDRRHRRFLDCEHAVIPTMRAVLSWNTVPSINPNVMPTFGNRIDADIQLARPIFFRPVDFGEIFKGPNLMKLIDVESDIKLKEPVAEKLDVIHKLNKEAGVPDHRTFYSTLGVSINSSYNFNKASSILEMNDITELDIDFASFMEFFNGAGKKADVNYEELTCVGLNSARDSLGAVIQIKKKVGYLGNLCSTGSNEHVAFWADWNNNGTFDEYLGTVSLNVHDIKNAPAGGLFYNVLLPVDFSRRLLPCNTPRIIRVRAVLSWESLPSATNPNQLNHYGNYKDALVQLRPAVFQGTGIHAAIHRVGNADRDMIHPLNHLYNYSVSPTIHNNRPWGGAVTFNGIIDRNGFNGVIKYRLLYKKITELDSAYKPVATSVTIEMDDLATLALPYDDFQTDPNGWFVYKQNPAINLYNVDNYLATWEAGSLADGKYTIRFVHTDELGNEQIADQFSITICNKGMNVSFTANASVDVASDLDLVIDGGDCHSYTAANSVIQGHLRAVHPYFAVWSLELEPASHTHGAAPSPGSRSYSFVADTGDGNAAWTLDTAPLDPCGYTVSLRGYTRVILNSDLDYYRYGPKAVGFAKLP
jgi:predicted lactoylglutathione lyase